MEKLENVQRFAVCGKEGQIMAIILRATTLTECCFPVRDAVKNVLADFARSGGGVPPLSAKGFLAK